MFEEYETASWYQAALHFLTAGFVIPFGVNFVLRTIVGATNARLYTIPFFLAAAVFGILAAWWGAPYSARHLRHSREMAHPREVVLFSSAYFVLSAVIFGTSTIRLVYDWRPELAGIYILGYVAAIALFAVRSAESFGVIRQVDWFGLVRLSWGSWFKTGLLSRRKVHAAS